MELLIPELQDQGYNFETASEILNLSPLADGTMDDA
jgi:hypothetical protein